MKMTFLRRLNDHIGELIHLRGMLYWRDRGWDAETDRICLLLDAAYTDRGGDIFWHAWTRMAHFRTTSRRYALLLLDGTPQWVCLAEEDVTFIKRDTPKI